MTKTYNELTIEVEQSLPPSDPLYQKVVGEAQMVLDAFDIVSFNNKRKIYEVWDEKGKQLIQTHNGPQSVQGYIFQLEKALLGYKQRLAEVEAKSLWTLIKERVKRIKRNLDRRYLEFKLRKI